MDETRYCSKEQPPNRVPDRLRGKLPSSKVKPGSKEGQDYCGAPQRGPEPALVLRELSCLSLPSPPVLASSPRYLPPCHHLLSQDQRRGARPRAGLVVGYRHETGVVSMWPSQGSQFPMTSKKVRGTPFLSGLLNSILKRQEGIGRMSLPTTGPVLMEPTWDFPTWPSSSWP